MIISELTGGLGNQMFQYATGFAAAATRRTRLRLDLRHYDHTDPSLPPRPYGLHRFTISGRPMSEIDRVWADVAHGTKRRAVRFFRKLPLAPIEVFTDQEDGVDTRLSRTFGSAYLSGLWQSEVYFRRFRAQLLQEFRFKQDTNYLNRAVIEKMENTNSVSVHFRRTDYLLQSTLTKPCGLDYYERAFEAMELTSPDAEYFIFTDDPTWVLSNANLPSRSNVITHNMGLDDGEDMRLMTHCRHFIIANSSFSWWGAWLARHVAKQVIAPTIWYPTYRPGADILVPESWMRV